MSDSITKNKEDYAEYHWLCGKEGDVPISYLKHTQWRSHYSRLSDKYYGKGKDNSQTSK